MSHFISEPAGIAKTWLCAWFALPVQSMLSLHKQPIYTYCLASLWYWWLRKIHMFHSFQTEMLVISRKFLWNIGQWFHYNSITTQKWLFKHGISQQFLYLGFFLAGLDTPVAPMESESERPSIAEARSRSSGCFLSISIILERQKVWLMNPSTNSGYIPLTQSNQPIWI